MTSYSSGSWDPGGHAYGAGEPKDSDSPPSGYQQPGYAQPGYGYQQPGYGYQQPGYGYNPPGYGYGYAPPPYPESDGVRTHAIIALVISLVLTMTCYVTPGGLTGAILSGIALSKADYEPRRARNLLRWCWISIGVNVGLIILGIILIVFFAATASSLS